MESEWNQHALARLLRANVIACCHSASAAMGFDRAVRSGSCLVRHLPYSLGGNALEMGIRLRVNALMRDPGPLFPPTCQAFPKSLTLWDENTGQDHA